LIKFSPKLGVHGPLQPGLQYILNVHRVHSLYKAIQSNWTI
jgi:hypothetical protein